MTRAGMLATVIWAALGLRLAWDATLAWDRSPRPLRKPLAELTVEAVGPGWDGEDLSLSERVEEVARMSSYLYRKYTRDRQVVWFYVGYVDSWNPGAIHEPNVCFPNSGLDLIARRKVEVPEITGLRPATMNEAQWASGAGEPLYSLSSFYYDSQLQPDVWKLRWDALFDVPFFAIVTLAGPQFGSLERTREVYFDMLRRALPALREHFPAEEPEAQPR